MNNAAAIKSRTRRAFPLPEFHSPERRGDQPSVLDSNRAIGHSRDGIVMSSKHDGHALAKGTDQLDDGGRGFTVQLAGRLVGKEKSRLLHHGAG